MAEGHVVHGTSGKDEGIDDQSSALNAKKAAGGFAGGLSSKMPAKEPRQEPSIKRSASPLSARLPYPISPSRP